MRAFILVSFLLSAALIIRIPFSDDPASLDFGPWADGLAAPKSRGVFIIDSLRHQGMYVSKDSNQVVLLGDEINLEIFNNLFAGNIRDPEVLNRFIVVQK